MTKFKYLLLCILLLTLVQQVEADYNFDGTPIIAVEHGIIAGGIYVDGGHGVGDAKSTPYTQSFDVPGTVVYARLYVGVWGATPERTGTVETKINGQTLGTLNLKGEADTNPNVACNGFGVYLVTYDVSSYIVEGDNTATVATAGDIDGRVYGVTLAAVYESEGAPLIEYWLNDGHENLNYKTPHDECATVFSAPTSTNPDASLTVGYLCGTPGQNDSLYMNGNQVGGDDVADSMGNTAYNFDLKTFDVSDHFDPSGNTLVFNRGEETGVHPFIAVLVLQNGTAEQPPPDDVKPDLVITEIKAPDRVFAEKDNTIEVIVRNQGNYDVVDAFDVELFANSISIESIRAIDLGEGESKTLQFIWHPDETIQYELRAMADVNSEINEADETNNEEFLAVDVDVWMGYYGDDSIETFEHGTINGSIVYTIGNSSYSGLLSPDEEWVVGFNLTLPDNATVRNARLYVYWTWSKDETGGKGKDAEMEVTFDDHVISAGDTYTDQKGYDPYNYPSGTYCYNVTDYIQDGNGSMINYTTIVKNTGTGLAKFGVCGINLLVIYEDLKEPEIEYWINEGCDMIYSKDDITPEDATTNIYFSGVVDLAEVRKATLLTFVTGGNEGGNELGFNTETWEGVYKGDPYNDLAIDERDVTDHLNTSGNYAYISEIDDCGMVPSTAILILERGQKVPKLDGVAVAVGEITDMGIHYISDDTYGAAFGTLRFAINDQFDRVAGYREAGNIVICAVPADCDIDYDLWLNLTATGTTRTLKIFNDPYTSETRDYITEICFCDEDDDGVFDDNETRVYRTVTSYDGTFALRLDGGLYDIYAKY